MRVAARRWIVVCVPNRKTVYLHIGLAKTGTTSLQLALQENASELAERGILFPGGTHGAQTVAVFDLLGTDHAGRSEPHGCLVPSIASPGRPRPGRDRLRCCPMNCWRLLGPATSSAGRVAPSASHRRGRDRSRPRQRHLLLSYQQEVFQGSTVTWSNYVLAVRTQQEAAGLSFWVRQDLLRVLGAWERYVAREDILIVPVPRAGQPAHLLYERFEEVLGLPAGGLVPSRQRRNASLGAAGSRFCGA